MNLTESFRLFIPEIFLVTGAFLAIFYDLFTNNKKSVGIVCLAVLAGTALLTRTPASPSGLFFNFFTLDRLTHFSRIAVLGIVAITILLSFTQKSLPRRFEGEFFSLFLFMAFALILMSASTNLLMIFMSIEFVSILSYLLTGFVKKNARSKEAAIKYFLYGSLASAMMLYGISLLFGLTGTIYLSEIQTFLPSGSNLNLILASFILILTGIGFKISMAPFHMWAPDVYEAAPTPVTAFLTVAPKAMGFIVLIRILTALSPLLESRWHFLILVLSILTMTIGNVLAISQVNIKRLLAYSSIAQAGYILMGIAVFTDIGLDAVLIYLLAYAFTNLGAFTVVMIASNHFHNDDLQSYSGLARRSPLLAASMTLFLLSLAGINRIRKRDRDD